MIGHGGSSAGSYLADPTSPIPSHCASIAATSTLRVKLLLLVIAVIYVYIFSSDIDECASSPCQNQSLCENVGSDYFCLCATMATMEKIVDHVSNVSCFYSVVMNK